MKASHVFSLTLALSLCGCAHFSGELATPNQLTAAEQRAGWKLLFDGKSLNGWRGYRKADAPPHGWVVENGCLHLIPKSHPGDIVTVEKFNDYEFSWEWRIDPHGNNGIKYLVDEERSAPGPEYQMIDDSTEDTDKRRTASLYDILVPAKNKPLKAPGEWNQSRVIVRGRHVEHWLNGAKVLEYELESTELKTAIAFSKFRGVAGFEKKLKGHILLTDHQDEAWYRNIKIREITSK